MRVPVSGPVYSGREVAYMQQAASELVLTGGHFEKEFAESLRRYLGVNHTVLCNSGSSANLLALSALCSPSLLPDRRLEPGDGVIVATTSFPTTVAPIYQNQLFPIYIDVNVDVYNIIQEQLEASLRYNPKAIMIAHTLGLPFDLDEVLKFCAHNGIWLVEDNCDALGSEWNGIKTGSFGHLSTQSFYPAHHITTGEGGAISTYDGKLKRIVESFRDWGRDCWCRPGCDNTCGKRFEWQLGALPAGYDHKYIYSHLGYNLKMTEMQAACGLAQMERIEEFTKRRRSNFSLLYSLLLPYSNLFILPTIDKRASPSPFGFPISIQPDVPFKRNEVAGFLESEGIATRNIFGGNLLRQPAFMDRPHALIDGCEGADFIMNNSFWVGCHHGLKDIDMIYIANSIDRFLERCA